MTSTYRLQLVPGSFTFDDARAALEYLDDLGVSHLYLSPILTATSGSTHGYDVVDPTTVSEGLGGRDGLVALSAAARERGMGLIVDIVPNHMGVAKPRENRWWWDVLRHGEQSPFASYFDIDRAADNGADGRLALPILGSADDLAALDIDRSGDQPELAFHEHRFPIAPGTDGADAAEVHARQSYRLVPWDSGLIGYRRFFAVNELAALRQEDPDVFEATHAQIASWFADDLVDGLRIDHPDGLTDPAGYLRRLRALVGPDRWLVVEKILASGEALDATLPVDGTTGYEVLARIDDVFVDRSGEAGLTDLSLAYTDAAGDAAWLEETERRLKRTTAAELLAPEVRRLARAVARHSGGAASGHPDAPELSEAIGEVVARLPVYRSDYRGLEPLLGDVLDSARRARPDLGPALDTLAAAVTAGGEAAARLQQVSGAVMAKSVEDCLFYRTARLTSLQEVGGDPGRFGVSPARFHLDSVAHARSRPASMTTLSTHDTKRGEDVRGRIGVLSQTPELWARCVAEWSEHTPAPDPTVGAFGWQTFLGVWPDDGTPAADVPDLRERLHAYAEKAMREASAQTTWTEPDERFEAAVHEWVDTVLDGPVGVSIGRLAQQLAPHTRSDCLGRKLVQLCGPGVPDVYQGTELPEDSLVDPDNRRPVVVGGVGVPPKLHVVRNALRLRRERPEVFAGAYTALDARGECREHVLGFVRGDDAVAVLATRTSLRLAERGGWDDTTVPLPDGSWLDVLTGTQHSAEALAADVFATYPVALLVRQSGTATADG
ncbi:malto-oligosyltrehalose synthase [Rhodococcus rhodnii]|uniref:Malto-oligosyltrehalose synthase n=1 Tax=Rhodococcus rhodnii TaxID=38312 RepID=A0A6P2CK71_9NOCA|nr:malto-oligosyltrehalose synthase [Rhodococcus rhodnii]